MFRHKNQCNQKFFDVNLNGNPVTEVTSTKYLGIMINNKLTYKDQIDQICIKLMKGNLLIAKLRHFVPFEHLKNFYFAHINSHINYGSLIWGSCAKTYIHKVKRLQDKSIRLLTFQGRAYHLNKSYSELDILQAEKLIQLNRVYFVWKILKNPNSQHMKKIFQNHGVINSNRTHSSSHKFIQPHRITEPGQKFITCIGIKNWNKLPEHFSKTSSANEFKKSVRFFLQDNDLS